MCSIHIPNEYENINNVLEIVLKNQLKYKNISENSKSLKIIGNVTQIFLNDMLPLEQDGIFVIKKENAKCHIYAHGKKNLRRFQRNYLRSTLFQKHAAKGIIKPLLNNVSYNTNQLKTIYKAPTTPSTTKAKIGVIQLGGGFYTSDLNAMWTYLGLTIKPTINVISIDGAKNNPGKSDEDVEVVLDIEILGGMCPNSTINVYFARNSIQSFYNAINRAISDGNQVISISWGAEEAVFGNSAMNAYNNLFKRAANLNISICVASGDNGSRDNGRTISVDFPSSSPNVLSVGGTTLRTTVKPYDNTTLENVWSGSGGGYSKFFSKPLYQQNIIKSGTKRAVPDVCANADPNTGYIIYLNGQFMVIGGTSAAAPLWAGFLASINYRKFINTNIYSLYQTNKNIVYDIKSGNNGDYTGATNYDLCSGLGSPNLTLLASLLTK